MDLIAIERELVFSFPQCRLGCPQTFIRHRINALRQHIILISDSDQMPHPPGLASRVLPPATGGRFTIAASRIAVFHLTEVALHHLHPAPVTKYGGSF
jgi:hypothetical protein